MRRVLLQVHLWLGLVAGLFLVVLGLTGSVMAFEGDIDHWLHPTRWYVSVGDHPLSEGQLIANVEQRLPPARVAAVAILPQRNLAREMLLSDRSTLTVDPYTGTIIDHFVEPTRTQQLLAEIHQIHLRLTPNPRTSQMPAGQLIVSYAGLILCVLPPTGLILWWRTKRRTIQWKNASWFRRAFDAHHVIGLYAGVFLWIAAFTGILIGFGSSEQVIYSITHSSRPSAMRPPRSAPPSSAAVAVGIDRAIAAARATMPTAVVDTLQLPLSPQGAYTVVMRVPEETSGSAHSSVSVDQFTGNVIQVHSFLTDSEGYRWIRFNRSIHTGDIFGLLGHVVTSVSSLLVVLMVITGVVIWWKKLAV